MRQLDFHVVVLRFFRVLLRQVWALNRIFSLIARLNLGLFCVGLILPLLTLPQQAEFLLVSIAVRPGSSIFPSLSPNILSILLDGSSHDNFSST